MNERFLRRLALAHRQALEDSQKGGRVEIHVGEAVYTTLRGLATEATGRADWGDIAWGFPLVIEHTLPTDHISVHAVRQIL